jgi:hypothetical protein
VFDATIDVQGKIMIMKIILELMMMIVGIMKEVEVVVVIVVSMITTCITYIVVIKSSFECLQRQHNLCAQHNILSDLRP